jgi:hypothetical protein
MMITGVLKGVEPFLGPPSTPFYNLTISELINSEWEGARGSVVVEELCYKLEVRGFVTR